MSERGDARETKPPTQRNCDRKATDTPTNAKSLPAEYDLTICPNRGYYNDCF